MKLPDLKDFDLNGKKVLVRVDLDVPLERVDYPDGSFEYKVVDTTRLEVFIPTIKLILEKGAKYVVILGHIGQPKEDSQAISTFCLWPTIGKLVGEETSFWPDLNVRMDTKEARMHLMENLRKYEGEEKNDLEFTKKLASLGDFYVNEAFATSHREHASIVGLPKLLPHAAGLSLLKEIDILSGVLEKPSRPVVIILGGAKEDKLEMISRLKCWADYILIGGKLPTLVQSSKFKVLSSENIIIAGLDKENKDISTETVRKFSEIIKKAGIIIWSGPMGQYEGDVRREKGEAGKMKWDEGTRKIGEAVVSSGAFTVIGGGDTEAALTKFGLVDKISYVSSGGGAMLKFLAHGSLPGIKALCE